MLCHKKRSDLSSLMLGINEDLLDINYYVGQNFMTKRSFNWCSFDTIMQLINWFICWFSLLEKTKKAKYPKSNVAVPRDLSSDVTRSHVSQTCISHFFRLKFSLSLSYKTTIHLQNECFEVYWNLPFCQFVHLCTKKCWFWAVNSYSFAAIVQKLCTYIDHVLQDAVFNYLLSIFQVLSPIGLKKFSLNCLFLSKPWRTY